MESIGDVLFAALGLLLVMWAAFWVIRLAVRYGVDDALRKHREITRPQSSEQRVD